MAIGIRLSRNDRYGVPTFTPEGLFACLLRDTFENIDKKDFRNMSELAPLFDPAAFAPEALARFQASFDAAWARHERDFAFDAAGREAARRVLAQAIIARHRFGDHDVASLQHHGLVALLQFRNTQHR